MCVYCFQKLYTNSNENSLFLQCFSVDSFSIPLTIFDSKQADKRRFEKVDLTEGAEIKKRETRSEGDEKWDLVETKELISLWVESVRPCWMMIQVIGSSRRASDENHNADYNISLSDFSHFCPLHALPLNRVNLNSIFPNDVVKHRTNRIIVFWQIKYKKTYIFDNFPKIYIGRDGSTAILC